LLDRYPDQVRYIVKHFPLSSHRFAFKAAMAALAANEQGKFWEFHQKLLENHNALDDKKIQSIAESLSLDMAKFNADLNSTTNQAMIQQDAQEGRAIGVSGTPSLFFNGKRVENRKLSQLPQMIEREIGKSQ
jgi:protein-disulfide isomerase